MRFAYYQDYPRKDILTPLNCRRFERIEDCAQGCGGDPTTFYTVREGQLTYYFRQRAGGDNYRLNHVRRQ